MVRDIIRLPLRLIPSEFTVRIVRGRLRGKEWIAGSTANRMWLGIYKMELQRAIEHSLSEGQVFFDVGANVGYFSLLASTLVKDTGQVIAFEPLPRNIAIFESICGEITSRTSRWSKPPFRTRAE